MYKPQAPWARSRATLIPWKIGDTLHMSRDPDPKYWPTLTKKHMAGMPMDKDRIMNCMTKGAPKSTERTANRLSPKRPRVQLRQAKMKLKV